MVFTLAITPKAFEGSGASYKPDCNDPDAHDLACLEPTKALIQKAYGEGYPYYIGHAEPTTEFFSTTGTSGNNMQWKVQLPATDPSPAQNGSSVANFELYLAFWMGLDLCDPNSNPFGSCVADSDSNNPATAGAAVLELQFYPPGINCSNTQWCAALHINTLQNNTAFQVANCFEPTTTAFVTTDGTPGGPELLMSNGDSILVTIHDTANGLETDVNDLTSATTGTMVASGANGFVHNSNKTDCTTTAFDFHAMYATASPGQVVPWAALGLNVALDFEIGHFELCADSSCSTLPDSSDTDDTVCATIRGIGGCFGSDLDHDGIPYLADWPDGTSAHPATLILGSSDDKGVGPLSTSLASTSDYNEPYNTLKFVTTEATTGAFYPFYSQAGTGLACRFNFGNDITGVTTDDFGKAAQYGTTMANPCPPGTAPTPTATPTATPTPTGVPEPLNVKPSAENFGSVSVGHGKVKTLTLRNPAKTGPPITFASPVAFSVPMTTPQEFGFPQSGATTCHTQLFPKKKCKLKVEFLPATPGPKSSAVTIFDNAGNANQTIPLQGTGK